MGERIRQVRKMASFDTMTSLTEYFPDRCERRLDNHENGTSLPNPLDVLRISKETKTSPYWITFAIGSIRSSDRDKSLGWMEQQHVMLRMILRNLISLTYLKKQAITCLFLPGFLYAENDFLTPIEPSSKIVAHYLQLKSPEKSSIFICYNYGCKNNSTVYISNKNIIILKKIFKSATNSADNERNNIAQAIAQMEQIAARQTPVYNDKAGNVNDKYLSGSMDCIDSTVNSSHYLQFLYQLGLIKYHEIQQPAYRSPLIFAQHWSAQIKDIHNGQSYAVDSWQSDNGKLPIIQKIEQWQERKAVIAPPDDVLKSHI